MKMPAYMIGDGDWYVAHLSLRFGVDLHAMTVGEIYCMARKYPDTTLVVLFNDVQLSLAYSGAGALSELYAGRCGDKLTFRAKGPHAIEVVHHCWWFLCTGRLPACKGGGCIIDRRAFRRGWGAYRRALLDDAHKERDKPNPYPDPRQDESYTQLWGSWNDGWWAARSDCEFKRPEYWRNPDTL